MARRTRAFQPGNVRIGGVPQDRNVKTQGRFPFVQVAEDGFHAFRSTVEDVDFNRAGEDVGQPQHFIGGQCRHVPVDAQHRTLGGLQRGQRLSCSPSGTVRGSLPQKVVEGLPSPVSDHGAVGEHALLRRNFESMAHQQGCITWMAGVGRNVVHGHASQALDEHAHVERCNAAIDHAGGHHIKPAFVP